MKDATVSARVECETKERAEQILQQLGIPVSVVINSLYRQIIYQKGIPFRIKLPAEPVTLDTLSEEQLNSKLLHSYQQSVNGEGAPVEEVFDRLERGTPD